MIKKQFCLEVDSGVCISCIDFESLEDAVDQAKLIPFSETVTVKVFSNKTNKLLYQR